jgi:long-subunit fatty acid transport protein
VSEHAGVDLAQLMIAPTWSYKLNENHAIGVSLKIAYQRFRGLWHPAFWRHIERLHQADQQ